MALIAPLTILTLLATALPAFAHHPLVSGGEPVCIDDGNAQITWTVRSDDPGRGKDWAVTAASVSGPGSPSVSIPLDTYQDESNDFTGTTTITQNGTYTLTVQASWNGSSQNVSGSDSVTVTDLQEQCGPDVVTPQPQGELGSDCGTWSAAVSVDALGDHEVAEPEDVTFAVFEVGQATALASVTLEPGESDTLSGVFDEDTGDRDLVLRIDGVDHDTTTVTTDCESDPQVELGNQCADDGIEVLLSNLDGPSAFFEVFDGEELIHSATLSGTTAPTVVLVPAAEGDTVDIAVHVDEAVEPLATYSLVRDCDDPVVTVQTCTPEATLAVTITEVPDDWFEVTVAGAELEEPLVQDGVSEDGTLTLYFDVPDGEYLVTVIHDGPWSHTQTVVVDCDEPVVEVATECVSEDGTVTVTVAESPEDAFTATIDGTTVDVVDGVAVLDGLEDGTYTVTVHDSEGELVHAEQVTVDCDVPDETEVEGVVIESPTPAPTPTPAPVPAPVPAPTPPAVAPAAQQLPATGADASLLGVVALLLLGLGVTFVQTTRRG